MLIVKTREELYRCLSDAGDARRGLVPTMGALHDGHLSLVEHSKSETEITIVSIFVNPTQFNDPDDLKKYPRDLESDINKLDKVLSDNDVVFVPSVEEVYSFGEPPLPDLHSLTGVMEGQFRPGHFDGVIRVVSILFDIIRPGYAYFGQKDFQQLTIIKRLVASKGLHIKVIGCPIIRETDGLAMSSRNMLLSKHLRRRAAVIYSTLMKYSVVSSNTSPGEIKSLVTRDIDSVDGFRTEYFEIVDDVELNEVNSVNEIITGRRYYGCVAAMAGNIRLIDNVEFFFHV